MEECWSEEMSRYKCSICAFARNDSIICACPAIRENPKRDAYFKARGSNLTEVEHDSVIKWFGE